jgi:hypothetical protein
VSRTEISDEAWALIGLLFPPTKAMGVRRWSVVRWRGIAMRSDKTARNYHAAPLQ